MGKSDSKVDQYILKSAPFARPILEHIRGLVHATCPDVEESIKWQFPCFSYCGEILCHMAAFKQHCTMGFWKMKIMDDPNGIFVNDPKAAMGNLGKITAVSDLPSEKILKKYLKQAMKLNEQGIKVEKVKPDPKKEIKIPEYFLTVLKKNKIAYKEFQAFSYSQRKEYVQWIEEAKTEATREKRMNTAVEWIEEGKGRNWKYE